MEPKIGKRPDSEAQTPQINYAEVMDLFWQKPSLLGLSCQVGYEIGANDSRAFFLRQPGGITVITRDGAFRASTGYDSDLFSETIQLAQDGARVGIDGGYSNIGGISRVRVSIPEPIGRTAIYTFSSSKTERTVFAGTLDALTPEELQEAIDAAIKERREKEKTTQEKIHELLSPQPVAS